MTPDSIRACKFELLGFPCNRDVTEESCVVKSLIRELDISTSLFQRLISTVVSVI